MKQRRAAEGFLSWPLSSVSGRAERLLLLSDLLNSVYLEAASLDRRADAVLQMELAKDFTHVPSHQQRTVLFRPGEFRTLATVRETVEALGIDWELLEDPHFLIEPAAFEKWASGRKGWSPIAQRWQAVRQKHSPARGRALRLVHSEPIKVSPNTHPGGCGTICQNARATAPIRGWEVLLMDQAI